MATFRRKIRVKRLSDLEVKGKAENDDLIPIQEGTEQLKAIKASKVFGDSNGILRIEWGWNNGDPQTFDVGEKFDDQNLVVFVNGQLLSSSQYNSNGEEGNFEILDLLNEESEFVIAIVQKRM